MVRGSRSRMPGPRVTVTSYWVIAAPVSLVAITVVRPGATPIRNRLVGEAGCTRAIVGSADMTVAAGCGRCSNTPVPATIDNGWLNTGGAGCCGAGGCVAGNCGAGAWASGETGSSGSPAA